MSAIEIDLTSRSRWKQEHCLAGGGGQAPSAGTSDTRAQPGLTATVRDETAGKVRMILRLLEVSSDDRRLGLYGAAVVLKHLLAIGKERSEMS